MYRKRPPFLKCQISKRIYFAKMAHVHVQISLGWSSWLWCGPNTSQRLVRCRRFDPATEHYLFASPCSAPEASFFSGQCFVTGSLWSPCMMMIGLLRARRRRRARKNPRTASNVTKREKLQIIKVQDNFATTKISGHLVKSCIVSRMRL